MKKLVLALAVAFGASMVACTSSEKNNEESTNAEAPEQQENVETSTTVVTDTVWVNDTLAVVGTDTIVVKKNVAPATAEDAPAEEGK